MCERVKQTGPFFFFSSHLSLDFSAQKSDTPRSLFERECIKNVGLCSVDRVDTSAGIAMDNNQNEARGVLDSTNGRGTRKRSKSIPVDADPQSDEDVADNLNGHSNGMLASSSQDESSSAGAKKPRSKSVGLTEEILMDPDQLVSNEASGDDMPLPALLVEYIPAVKQPLSAIRLPSPPAVGTAKSNLLKCAGVGLFLHVFLRLVGMAVPAL